MNMNDLCHNWDKQVMIWEEWRGTRWLMKGTWPKHQGLEPWGHMNGGEHADVWQWHMTPLKTCWKIPKKALFKAVQMFSFNVITLLARSYVLLEFMGISQKCMHSLIHDGQPGWTANFQSLLVCLQIANPRRQAWESHQSWSGSCGSITQWKPLP